MVIRRATVDDLGALLRMALRFAESDAYRTHVQANAEQLERLIRFLLEHGAVFVAQLALPVRLGENPRPNDDDVVGMIAAHVLVHWIGGELIGSEVAWWIEPQHRGSSAAGRLLRAAEEWARDAGAEAFQMIAPAGSERLEEFYLRRGYMPVESVFQRKF